MSSALPLELILLLIPILGSERDEESLKNFSLTSSVFRIPCHKALFSHIRLVPSLSQKAGRYTPGERLLDLLSSSPAIASYVRYVTISDYDHPWLQTDMALGQALDNIDSSQIEGFVLQSDWLVNRWDSLPVSTRTAIIKICRSPFLKELSLWHVPLELVNVCGPSLKYLRIYDCGLGPQEMDLADLISAQQYSAIVLNHLRFYHLLGQGIRRFVRKFPNVRVDCLRTLDVKMCWSGEHHEVFTLVRRSRSTLENLVLEPCTDIRDVSDIFPVEDCPRLATVHLRADANTRNSDGEVLGLPWAASFICNIPPSNDIREIRLSLHFPTTGNCSLNRDTQATLLARLNSLGSRISDPTAFPQLKAFRVHIRIPNPTQDDIKNVHGWAMRQLSNPQSRNLLHLTVSRLEEDDPEYGTPRTL
ncbi:hypothetical protein NMY22_g19884 [Coprinellus aureogranulatus]|nr:hypothetical protein NMY22_g19884 [Coprinellus aureogranulatus]